MTSTKEGCGMNTRPKSEEDNKIEYGLWEDNPYSVISTEKYAKQLNEYGIDSVALMLNQFNGRDSSPAWKLLYTLDQVKTYHSFLKKYNVKLVLTVWPRPDKVQIDTLIEGAKPFIDAVELEMLDNDNEANWRKKFLKGFKDMDEASVYLAEQERKIVKKISSSTFPGHAEISNPKFFKLVDLITGQMYGVRSRSEGEIEWDDPNLGPGGIQKTTIEKMKKIGPEIECGLPHYDQHFPGHTELESLQKQYNTAKQMGIKKFRGWSGKWCFGKVKKQYNKDFLTWLKTNK